MKKLLLTDEVVKSLNFLIDGAMRFYGFPGMSAHQEIITKAITDDVEVIKEG